MAADPKPITMKIGFKRPLPVYADAERARQVVQRATRITMSGSVNILHGAVVMKTPFAFGLLRQSITAEVLDVSQNITGRVSTPSPYGWPVETGSRPHWAPLEPLVLWARRKLGLSGLFAISAARRIRFKIAQKGTKAHWMFARAFRENKDRVRKLWRDAQSEILKNLKQR